jgi:CDP-4-dehydro-6-deoxyglucose reductase
VIDVRPFVMKNFIYKVQHCALLAEDISRILLTPTHAVLNYQPGQYLQVVHHDGSMSPLSIASAPNTAGMIEIHLTHHHSNPTAQGILVMAKESGVLTLQGPFGECTADKLIAAAKPIIFLARGTGFAPIKAIIETLIPLAYHYPSYFYWSSVRAEQFYDQDLLLSWQKADSRIHYLPILSKSQPGWMNGVGLLQDVVLQNHPDLSNCQVYACASPKIIYGAWDVFSRHGLTQENYYSDMFRQE